MTAAWLGWMAGLLGRPVALEPGAMRQLETWRGLPESGHAQSLSTARFVVVDVETSGLDVYADRLIAIGAARVDAAKISLDQGFHVVLRQAAASADENILVHRIGGTAQMEGMAPIEALLAFLQYAGKAPLVGFHAAFDQHMIAKTTRKLLGERFRRPWIDLAALAPALYPELAPRMKGLDDWCQAFGIQNLARHDALADALATAQLLQVLLHRAAVRGLKSVGELAEAARAQAWLDRARR